MHEQEKKYKIVYCIPALYLAGGMERVLTVKANYFAEVFGYDITIILTDGKGKPFFYPLSNKIKTINLDIQFEELWNQSFIKKAFLFLKKQHRYKKALSQELTRLHPDFTVSLLRREINFINSIKDGSRKIGEIHINREHYRTFEEYETNFVKRVFSKYWQNSLVKELKKLDCFVVLTDSDQKAWKELHSVKVIPNPLSFNPTKISPLTNKRIISIGRYCHEKGFDILLQAWSMIQEDCKDWHLAIYGDGDRTFYDKLIDKLHIDRSHCALYGRTNNIEDEFYNSSISVCSSRFEGFGMVIAEAMACGLPVISFDCPWGPRSIITDRKDGLLVENGNVDEFARAIISLINDDETRLEYGKNARINIQRFSIESVANKWYELFNSIQQ